MKAKNIKTEKRMRAKKRVRAKISGSSSAPRLSVYKSNKFIYAQLIDDLRGVTVASASDLAIKSGAKTEKAVLVGETIAKLAKSAGVNKVIFDRNGFKYTGRIKFLADSARKTGLNF